MLGRTADAEPAPGATNMARPSSDDTPDTEAPVEPASPVATASGRPWPERTRVRPAFFAPGADALCKAAGPTSTAAQEVDDSSEDGSDADSEDTDAGTSDAHLLPRSLLAGWWYRLGAQD